MEKQETIDLVNSKELDYHQYMNFVIGKELFAFEIESVREVLNYCNITEVPLLKKVFKGVINIRGKVVPVIDLYYRIYEKESIITDSTRILVIEVKYKGEVISVGALVDKVENVINIYKKNTEIRPELGLNFKDSFIKKIAKQNKHFITILETSEVFNIEELSKHERHYLEFSKTSTKNVESLQADKYYTDSKDDNKIELNDYVTFYVNKNICAIEMTQIKEIIEMQQIHETSTSIPFIKGLINVRELIIPAVDMKLRCNFPYTEYGRRSAIILVYIEDMLTGLLVDQIIDVKSFDRNKITKLSYHKYQQNREYIYGFYEQNNKLVTIINISKLLTRQQADLINNNLNNKDKDITNEEIINNQNLNQMEIDFEEDLSSTIVEYDFNNEDSEINSGDIVIDENNDNFNQD